MNNPASQGNTIDRNEFRADKMEKRERELEKMERAERERARHQEKLEATHHGTMDSNQVYQSPSQTKEQLLQNNNNNSSTNKVQKSESARRGQKEAAKARAIENNDQRNYDEYADTRIDFV